MKHYCKKSAYGETKKFRPLLLTAIVCTVMYIFTQLILTPIYTLILSNKVYQSTVLPYILKLILSFAEILTFGICFSIVIYTAVIHKARTATAVCGIYIAASVIRRAAALGVSFLMYDFIDKRDIFNVSLPIIIEAVQIFTVLLATYLAAKRYRQALHSYVARIGDAEKFERLELTSVYDSKNPLLVGTLTSFIMLAIINVSMRIYSDIGYGAPTGASEIFVMIAYYLFDILICVILYTVCWITISKLLSKYGNRISQ